MAAKRQRVTGMGEKKVKSPNGELLVPYFNTEQFFIDY